jgi:hypothetical protein
MNTSDLFAAGQSNFKIPFFMSLVNLIFTAMTLRRKNSTGITYENN